MPAATEVAAISPVLDASAPFPVQRVEHGRVIRDDIQLLRGIAVLSVLLYHADKLLLAGGYLGVDVFFVLSGFLITRNIYRDIERGTFSYTTFIAQRFRRLLPACYAMLVFSTALAGVFLLRQEIAEFLKQVLGTLTFSSNLVLWRQTGYFDTASSLKLLLHTWSLSLEEQYYLFLPPILYAGARSNTVKLLVILFAISLLACFLIMPYKPSAAFYLLPFRAWELLAGSVCAVLAFNGKAPAVPTFVKWAALAVLMLTMAFPPTATHPGLSALIVVLATSLLMLGAIDFGRKPVARGMYFVGDISYSLYLVHWPLFAVANHVYAGTVPMPVNMALIGTAVLLAYLSYRLVEQPFRGATSMPRKKVLVLAAVAGVLVMLLSLLVYAVRSPAPGGSTDGSAPNYGLGKTCAYDADFLARPECQSSARPSVLLWGDSYAMHLADAMEQQKRFGFVQATKSQCGPVPEVAPVMGVYNEAWAQTCLSFNASVLSYLDAHPEIRLVVLGSRWRQYFNVEGQDGFLVRSPSGTTSAVRKSLGQNVVAASMRTLVERLTASGRQVLIVEPPPSADFDVYRCVQRKREGLPYVGASADCRINQAAAASRDAGLSGLLHTLKPITGQSTYSFNDLLCDGTSCRSELDNVALYRDEGHFSPQGSRIVGQKSGLNGAISRLLGNEAQ